jgi:hypothetical protein
MKQKPPQSLLGLPPVCAFAPLLFGAFAVAACGGTISGQKTGAGGAAGTTGSGNAGTTGLGGMSMVGGASGGPGNMGFPAGPLDLCQGLIQDKAAHPMTTVAKPALGAAITEPQFNTTIRRITAVTGTSNTPALRPLYSTVAAWNADESRLLLLNISAGRHELYDGKTYAFIRGLVELNPPDVEQIFWHTTDPDLLLYVENRNFIRYHVGEARKEIVTAFDFCTGGGAGGGEDPMFSSFDSNRFGLGCGNQVFIYDLASNTVIARKTLGGNPVQIAPSGALGFLSDTGDVTDASLNVVRRLDMKEPYGHASMGRWPTGEDTWNGQVFDDGPMGNTDIGSLVTFDMTRGVSKVIIGPKTGYPYPPDGHVSAMAFRQPGWVVVSTFGKTSGAGLLDEEILIADTVSNKVCRAGRHRSWGKDNTMLNEPYWAEPHAVPSPTGTRIVFASDWSNGASVDTYVVELPSYTP